MSITTDFDQRSGIIYCMTEWGRWWQTVSEVGIEINLPKGTKSRELTVDITNTNLKCSHKDKCLVEGKFFNVIRAKDSVWTIEEGSILSILLCRSEYIGKEAVWTSLFEGGAFAPDPHTLFQMRKKLDLEKFQIENPGMNFSSADLDKRYESI